jgi:hypothetical protein
MFGRSRFRCAICRSIAAVMFFAQAIGVAQACIEATQSPTMAFSDPHQKGDCDKTVNKNACLQQYTAGNQSSAQVQGAVAAMPAIAVLTVPVAPVRVVCPAVALASLAHSPDPPPSIRFCSFQL